MNNCLDSVLSSHGWIPPLAPKQELARSEASTSFCLRCREKIGSASPRRDSSSHCAQMLTHPTVDVALCGCVTRLWQWQLSCGNMLCFSQGALQIMAEVASWSWQGLDCNTCVTHTQGDRWPLGEEPRQRDNMAFLGSSTGFFSDT